MAVDTKVLKRVCPLCGEEYSEEDSYCGKDGTLLVSSDPNPVSSTLQPNDE